jgi:hypothetical protein
MVKPDIIDISKDLPRANPQNVEYRALAEIDRGVWHYDDVLAPEQYDPVARYKAQARYHIDKVWGRDRRGRPVHGFGLMYHFRVSRDGRIWQTQPLEIVTWHARGANTRALAICGDLGEHQAPSEAQLRSMVALSDWLTYDRADINIGRAGWWGHGELVADGNDTKCPAAFLPHVRAYRTNSKHL